MFDKYIDIFTALKMGANPSDVYNHLLETDAEFREFVRVYENTPTEELIKELIS